MNENIINRADEQDLQNQPSECRPFSFEGEELKRFLLATADFMLGDATRNTSEIRRLRALKDLTDRMSKLLKVLGRPWVGELDKMNRESMCHILSTHIEKKKRNAVVEGIGMRTEIINTLVREEKYLLHMSEYVCRLRNAAKETLTAVATRPETGPSASSGQS